MNEQDADGARLADALAAEFDREARRSASPASAAAERAPHGSRAPWIVAGLSLVVILVQLPTLRASFAARPSLHAGAALSDPDAEACIDQLWMISALVQQGESAAALAHLPLTEPVTHERYVISREGDALVVACPNPSLHGLARLRITENAPMPEASR